MKIMQEKNEWSEIGDDIKNIVRTKLDEWFILSSVHSIRNKAKRKITKGEELMKRNLISLY